MAIRKPIKQVLKNHTPELMALPGVIGTAESSSDGKSCLMVMVLARTPEIERRIPKQLDGYPVRIEVTGEIRARGKSGLK